MAGQPVFALIDCNNFFASCERVFRPDLWNKPVAVLSNNDGCIIARSNEVKAMGVPMGAPLFKYESLLKQHDAAIFSANFSLYGDMSQRVTAIIRDVAPNVEVYSIDESFVEVSQLADTDYMEWARMAERRILGHTGIPVSIGVGPTKTLAKAAAEFVKRSAEGSVHVALHHTEREALLKWLPIGDVWGVGRRLTPRLQEVGISSAWQLTQVSDDWALHELTVKGLTTVKELQGEPILRLERVAALRKTINRSRAFSHTVRDYHQLESAVASFTAQSAAKLRAQGSICGGVITYLKTRKSSEPYRSLAVLTPLAEPSADTGYLISSALEGLMRVYDHDFGYTKAGVMLVDISSRHDWQLSLLTPQVQRDRKARLMEVVDALNRRWGADTVWHASQDSRHAAWQSKHEHRSPAYTTSWADLPIAGA